jgi:outer membrane protein assembly factor BamD (BamD/ComL family)
MGGKRARIGKYLNLCITLSACFLITACALVDGSRDKTAEVQVPVQVQEASRQHLALAQDLLVSHEFEAAVRENQQVLYLSPDEAPADEALFNMGAIYANPANLKRDDAKSIAALERLVKDFPQSPWAEQAKSWLEMFKRNERLRRLSMETTQENDRLRRTSVEALQENERLKRVSGEAFQENDKLKRASAEMLQENQKLKKIVEQSRMVDIEIDEKKRNQAK